MPDQSFMKSLFHGVIAEDLVSPYPEMAPAEREFALPLLDRLRAFSKEHIDSRAIDASAHIPPEVFRGLREQGLFGLLAPKAHGGAGLSTFAYARTMQELGGGASERPRLAAEARALGAQAIGHLLYYKHAADVPLFVERIGVMPEELQGSAWEGFGFSLAYHYPEDRPIENFVRVVAVVPPRFRAAVGRGISVALGPGMEQVKPLPPSPRTAALLAVVASLDAPKPDQ